MTVDEENGIAYLPVESPTSDFYGGARPGDNLFGESLVAVDLETGERLWHFQIVHHPIWDHDLSSAPLLMDIAVDGEEIPAVALPTKQNLLFVFNRLTGEPVWPIEETEMLVGDVPGEWYSPTQPIPSRPPAYGRNQIYGPEDVIDFTPALHEQAMEILSHYRMGPLYNPPVAGEVGGIVGAINVGNASGGTNWPGAAFDPETNIVYAPASTSAVSGPSVRVPPEGFTDLAYQYGVAGQRFRIAYAAGTGQAPGAPEPVRIIEEEGIDPDASVPSLSVDGLPIAAPPYGVLSAIDVNAGELLWSVPHGDTPDEVRDHPALEGLDIPKTGQRGSVGNMVTATLVVMGDPSITTHPVFGRGAMLRAYDKATGEQVGAVPMPAQQSGSPMTYMVDGRQYIVVAVGGGAYPSEYIAYALPQD